MKLHIKLLILLSIFFLTKPTVAQTDEELSKEINSSYPLDYTNSSENEWQQKTIFNSSEKSSGYYAAFGMKYGTIENSNIFFAGGKGAWIKDHKLALGFGAYGLYGDNQNLNVNIKYNYSGGYAGFIVEPLFYSSKVINFSIPIMLGGGWVFRVQKFDDHSEIMYSDLVYLSVEPGLEVNLNITQRFRIALGAYYTIANDIDSKSELDDAIMNNLSIGLQFKWGVF